ncbi:MAG: DUF29 family protein [Planctomycetaceae bacterium]|nr:DUF29 family protein [Planctomycetaceae bacterium]MBV8608352.1 DUF29 family protein [Singulisphaera sp.]MBV8266996.1 DUF29 family protein [Planctomycetaceae bacterium]MBV8316679.1 DUF29 family protein [Planctomycetaceae bacterium]MBV8384958.1 DUF29 family protein [Planctomycetaceae bacterium]
MFVDEYQELHDLIVCGDYSRALALINELDAMSRRDYVLKIRSYMRVLLVHLIKHHAEGRWTMSWRRSVAHAIDQIHLLNARHKAGGTFLDPAELRETLEDAWRSAIELAAIEVKRGAYTTRELEQRVDRDAILAEALARIADAGTQEGRK